MSGEKYRGPMQEHVAFVPQHQTKLAKHTFTLKRAKCADGDSLVVSGPWPTREYPSSKTLPCERRPVTKLATLCHSPSAVMLGAIPGVRGMLRT